MSEMHLKCFKNAIKMKIIIFFHIEVMKNEQDFLFEYLSCREHTNQNAQLFGDFNWFLVVLFTRSIVNMQQCHLAH